MPRPAAAARPSRASLPLRWGALIQREMALLSPLLLAGCAQPPPPEAPPAPAASVRAAPEPAPRAPGPAADPPDAKAGVGPLLPVTEAEPEENYPHNFVSQSVTFGKGVFTEYQFERSYLEGAPRCSIQTTSPLCRSYSIGLFTERGPIERWPLPLTADEGRNESQLFASPAEWIRFSPGKGGVYAVRRASEPEEKKDFQIDFIREDGKVETFLQDPSAGFSDAVIVETKGGHLGVFRLAGKAAEGRGYRSVGQLVVGRVIPARPGRRVEVLHRLDVGDVWYDGRASDARDARTMHRHASHGPLRLVPLLDGKGGLSGETALVWVEALPPEGRELEGEEGEGTRKKKKRSKKAKNQCGQPDQTEFLARIEQRSAYGSEGCGGRMSRPLSHPDVGKKLHIVRLGADGKPRGERVEPLSDEFDAQKRPMQVWPREGGGLSVGGRLYDSAFKRLPAPQRGSGEVALGPSGGPGYSKLVPQRLVGGRFDAASGEALVIFKQASFDALRNRQKLDTTRARVVSALGAPLDDVVDMPELDASSNPPAMARGKDAWIVVSNDDRLSFRVLGGPHHGAMHPIPLTIPSCKGSRDFVHIEANAAGLIDYRIRCNGVVFSTTIHTETLRVTPFVDASGAPTATDAPAAPDASAAPGAPPADEPDDLFSVWGDQVAIVRKEKRITATWIKAGKSLSLDSKIYDSPDEHDVTFFQYEGERGPVLPSRLAFLPVEPGQPIPASAELKKALSSCPLSFATGPRRLLLLCAETTSDQAPGVLVGARVFRY